MKRNKVKKGLFLAIALVLMLLLVVSGCTQEQTEPEDVTSEENTGEENAQEVEDKEFIMATTTSTENSGLLDFILPIFKEDTGIEVKVVAVGTGNAIQMGEDGEADLLLVHAKASEEEFVSAGHGLERFDVMYNDFVIIGPESDPANISENSSDVVAALKSIMDSEETFVSRGDDSGTHKKELQLWEAAEIEPAGDWYIEAGQGMGDTIQMAEEMLGYTLSDRATYLSMSEDLDLKVLVEGDEGLFNQYGVIAVNPDKNDQINNAGAEAFIEWILSDKAQSLIEEFGQDEYGQSLFIPNAK
jgi:tungstate transport system substrate-binding protein